MAPSILQGLLRDNPYARSYATGDVTRMPANLAVSFERYLSARLDVHVGRPEEIVDWLRTCRYVSDRELFGRDEVWVHPEDFERLRAGDCEDHALWAWVQYVRLGWNARLTAGWHKKKGHAWVTLYRGGAVHVCETTAKGEGYRPNDARACPEYEPVWSVDGGLGFHWHGPKEGTPDIVFLE